MDTQAFRQSPSPTATNVEDHVEHHYAENKMRNHYVALGEDPPILMLYGFPDY